MPSLSEIAERRRAASGAGPVLAGLVPAMRDFGAAIATGRREAGSKGSTPQPAQEVAIVAQVAGGPEQLDLALALDDAEVPALCIATDAEVRGGTRELLAAVARKAGAPVLARDFIVGQGQIYEARALGADAVTLMPALLDDAALRQLGRLAISMHMAVVHEVRSEAEARRALAAGGRILLAEPFDIESGRTDADLVAALSRLAPPNQVILIAPASAAEVAALQGVADAALVSNITVDALRALVGS